MYTRKSHSVTETFDTEKAESKRAVGGLVGALVGAALLIGVEAVPAYVRGDAVPNCNYPCGPGGAHVYDVADLVGDSIFYGMAGGVPGAGLGYGIACLATRKRKDSES